MKRFLLPITTLLIVLASCKKEAFISTPKPISIEEAKAFFGANAKNTEKNKPVTLQGADGPQSLPNKQALWDRAYLRKIFIGDAVISRCITPVPRLSGQAKRNRPSR